MIIENGTIELKQKNTKGIDPVSGFALKSDKVFWSGPIPCQWSPIRYNNLSKSEGGNFTEASYSILIEREAPFVAEQIKLRDNYGNVLGEFSVIKVEILQAVCQQRITV